MSPQASASEQRLLAPSRERVKRGPNGWLGLAVPVALVGVWAAVTATGFVSPRILPNPGAVATAAYAFLFGDATTTLPGVVRFEGAGVFHIVASLRRLLVAFCLAAAVGVPLGLALGLSHRVALVLDPLVQALRPIPIFAWLPLGLAWFGLGEGAARFLIFIGAVFPIVVSTADGVMRVPRAWAETALMLGTSRSQLPRRVYLPATLPSIVTGLRLGLTLGWMSVIVGELTGTRQGLGAMMMAAREVGRLDRVIVGMAFFALLGLGTDLLVRRVSRRFTRWASS
ncbi:MAG: ABC transporter permease [Euzebyales bacterium]|nr:ABC transporter permease [Euzebyales bacterium]